LFAALLLTSCAGADLTFGDDPPVVTPPDPVDPDPTEGTVVIRPDQSEHALPAQLYYFYPLDEDAGTRAGQDIYTRTDEETTTQDVICLACDGQGNFSGSLPVGSYHVLAVNRDVVGGEYQAMERYETARVSLTTNISEGVMSRSDTLRHCERSEAIQLTHLELDYFGVSARNDVTRLTYGVPSLGLVYSTVLQNITIEPGGSVTHTPAPVLLTRTLTFRFDVASSLMNRLTGLQGSVQGVYPSVHLFSQATADEEIARGPDLRTSFEATSDGTQWQAVVTTFGLRDPQHGEAYENTLSLTLTLGSETTTVEVDLTEPLSVIMDKYEGNLPIAIPLEMNIVLEWDGVEVEAKVRSWKDGGNTEVIVDR